MSQFKHLVKGLNSLANEDRRDSDKDTAQRMLDQCFKEQADFILDRSRRKSALCPRRAGKSFSCLVLMCRTALLRPGSVIEYVCLTRGQAKKNLWRTLKAFNDNFELSIKFHETNITATFPNGSLIEFMGGETRQEIEKFRGQSFDLVVIDEGKSFQFDILEEMIEEVISPALTDRLGTMAMIGTPGNVLAGPFYEATSDYNPIKEVGVRTYKPRPYKDRKAFKENKWKWNWSFHKWHTKHNTAMPHIWVDILEQKEIRGTPDNDPRWLREYEGKWTPSDSLMVYSFNSSINTYDGNLPEDYEWQYVLGVDLGYNDSTGFVVAAYSDTHPELYQVYELKVPELTFDGIKSHIKRIERKYELEAIVIDTGGLGKTIMESFIEHGISCVPAVKTDKLDHIELVNSDLRAGRIKLLPDSALGAEMQLLQWKDNTFKKENKGTDNHLCDAFLYQIRHAYHHFWEAPVSTAKRTQAEIYAQWEEDEIEKALQRRSEAENGLDAVFDTINLDGDWIN